MPNFTPEDLLLYESGELDEMRHNAITNELKTNWALREKFNVLIEAVKRIDGMKLQSPGKQSLENIMRYALHKTVNVQ
ncbi:hypothetical protein [Parafilimonas sp.]|uniref:hypothetical protein n=1 Tax=Parafilimonas sp. TaxID=1969739 RepID=UPI0039E6EE4B